jgi:hypothetical protein
VAKKSSTAIGRNSLRRRQNLTKLSRFLKLKNWNATDMQEPTLQFLIGFCPHIAIIRGRTQVGLNKPNASHQTPFSYLTDRV